MMGLLYVCFLLGTFCCIHVDVWICVVEDVDELRVLFDESSLVESKSSRRFISYEVYCKVRKFFLNKDDCCIVRLKNETRLALKRNLTGFNVA